MPEDPTVPVPPPVADLQGLDAGELFARGLQTAQPSAGAAAWEPPTPEELAKLLPQYRIESLLGRGGMGAVYKGVQAALDRPVAIKLLPAELAGNGDFLARFQREARTLAKLQHSGIVTVYDFGQTSAGHLYFVMEYVDGTDLHHILKGPGLKPEQAFVVIGQICEALHYAHQQGVIHRDIKPANILITKDGRAKVADFGIARPVKDDTGSLTVTNMIMGTPDYMAPEQRTGDGHPDHRADIFALGVMLYEMLTGQRPHGAFQPPSHRVQVDVRIDEVVLKALQQEPDRRYQQASEMKVDVDRIRTTPPAPAKPKRSSWRIAALVAVGILCVLALLAAIPAVLRSFAQRTTPAIASAESKVTRHADGLWNLPWQKAVWAKQDDPRVSADGWLTVADNLQSAAPHRVPGELLKLGDGAVRAQVRSETTPSSFAFVMSFWLRMPLNQSIQFVISEWEIRAIRNGDNAAELGRIAFDTPFRPGDIERFEAAAVGDRFIARFKGKELRFQDPQTNRSGSTTFHGRTYALKDVEYAVLDGIADPLKALGWEVPANTIPPVAAASSSAPLTATKDKPFVNTLGQEFVPVPGTQVLFCRWETRVKDYAEYARVNRVAGEWAIQEKDGVPVGREPEHPVCAVSWDDANAFCKWLTEKESAEGKLPEGIKYRLPTDEEWSQAVGLKNETGAKPAEKSRKNGVDLLWGVGYPPTGKVGNYADEAHHEKFSVKQNGKENEVGNQWIEGYTDGYATTSPVGSFPPNAYGLHDMGGNVWEWCEDRVNAFSNKQDRVMRGAAWTDYRRGDLLSSHRGLETPGYRGKSTGFRCVLAPAPSTPPAAVVAPATASSSASSATATKDAPFVNTLGMKFVPVPGSDTLMCIHETRRKDYAAYADAVPGVDATWKNPLVEGKLLAQDDQHPVVMVSWEDATAFCAWLSQKEGRTYRLPTEREWNLAAVFEVSDPGTLSDTDLMTILKPQYPWGTKDQQDGQRYGNYSSKEDGHAGTAPVMSFLPNQLGLYDLGGNAWEWCSAGVGENSSSHYLRGCGYLNGGPYRNSGTRESRDPGYRSPIPPLKEFTRGSIPGFRIVLEPAPSERAAKVDEQKPAPAPKDP